MTDARWVASRIPASLQIDQNRSFSGRNGDVPIDVPFDVWMTRGVSIFRISSSSCSAASGSAKEMNGGVNSRPS